MATLTSLLGAMHVNQKSKFFEQALPWTHRNNHRHDLTFESVTDETRKGRENKDTDRLAAQPEKEAETRHMGELLESKHL